ncbi:hypothetical protein BwSH20_76550 [Bradyrhizobium ottawaense]|nr:hypothetical protein BwSH20_76550 [Bradyrhizobium ottawaense]
MLNDLDLGASPLDDENVTIDQRRRDPYVDKRTQRRKIYNDIVIALSQAIKELAYRAVGQKFARVKYGPALNGRKNGKTCPRIPPYHLLEWAITVHDFNNAIHRLRDETGRERWIPEIAVHYDDLLPAVSDELRHGSSNRGLAFVWES